MSRQIIIFGCSNLGKQIYEQIREIKLDLPICFLDNDKEKRMTEFCGEQVISLEDAAMNYREDSYITASYRFYREMRDQLKEIGVAESNIFFPGLVVKVLEAELYDTYEKVKRRLPRKELKFAVDLAEHCNLNCQNCDHFSPLAREHFTDLKQYEADLKRLKELFGENVAQIDLEGGEPLLHPNAAEFIKVTYQYFPKALINIFTNGLLLPKMEEKFWDTCRQCGTVLEVTKYPIALDYDGIEALAKEKGVVLHYYGGDVVKTSRHQPIDLEGRQDKWESFCNCFLANECIMLKKGRLYTCTVLPNIEHFNRYFDKDIEVTEQDSIDIYEAQSEQEILEFLCQPVPACRYCKVSARTGGHVWGTSKRAIEEWI